jgi:hypothetical protein
VSFFPFGKLPPPHLPHQRTWSQCRRGRWLSSVAPVRAHGVGLVGGDVGEGPDHISIGGIREFVSFFGEPMDVVPRATRALVGALEVPDERSPEVGPIIHGADR